MHTLRYTFATRLAEQNFTEDSGTSTMRYSRTLEGQKDKAVDVLDAEKTNGCTQTAKNFTSPNNKKAEKHQTSRLVACLNKKDILEKFSTN